MYRSSKDQHWYDTIVAELQSKSKYADDIDEFLSIREVSGLNPYDFSDAYGYIIAATPVMTSQALSDWEAAEAEAEAKLCY